MSDEFYVITTTKGKPKLIENYSDKKHADAAMEQLKKHDKRLSYSVVNVKELQKMKLDPNKDSDWAEITEGRAPSKSDMKSIVPDALDAFWAVIAKHYKKFGITTGDLDVTTEMRFEKAAEDAVTVWVEGNYISESTVTKTKKTAVNESIKSFEQFIELSEADLTAQVITDYIWGRKGATIGDKVLNLLFKAGPDGAPATRASAIASRLKNAGYTDKQVGIIRDVATQSMKAAIDQVKTAKKLIGDVVTTNQDSFGVYQFRHILVDDKDIKEAMVTAEKLMHMKIQKLQKELTVAGN